MGKARKTRECQGGAGKSREARQISGQARVAADSGRWRQMSRSIATPKHLVGTAALLGLQARLKALAPTATIVEPAANFVWGRRRARRKGELGRLEAVLACAGPQREALRWYAASQRP